MLGLKNTLTIVSKVSSELSKVKSDLCVWMFLDLIFEVIVYFTDGELENFESAEGEK